MKKILLIALLLLTSCQSNTINVGTWKTPQTSQPFFYHKYIKETIDIIPFTNPGDMKTALLANHLDMCGSTIVTAILSKANNEPIVIVAGLSNKCSSLVVNHTINDIQDLKGKKIGYVFGTIHHFNLLEVLKQANLDPNHDVELIKIDFFDMNNALATKSIDAYYSGEPFPTEAVNNGLGKIIPIDSIDSLNAVMITTKDHIKNNRKTISSLIKAHKQATIDLNNNPQTIIDNSSLFSSNEKTIEQSLNNITLFYDIDKQYIERVKNLAEAMVEQGMIKEMIDVEQLIDLSFLHEQ